VAAAWQVRLVMAVCWCSATAIGAVVVTIGDLPLSFIVSVLGCTACTLVQFHFPARMCTQLGRPRAALMLHTLFFTILVVGMFTTLAGQICEFAYPTACPANSSSSGSGNLGPVNPTQSSFCKLVTGG
jgi:hypothetical protein